MYGCCGCSCLQAAATLAGMAVVAPATAFVTSASGFVGTELIRVLVARGHQVIGLTGSLDGAARVRHAGGTAVIGSLLEPGQWQDEAAADWVFHVPPHPREGMRVPWMRAASMSRARVSMDAHLLDAVSAGTTQRIVYVADTRWYGATGARPITEDEPPRPSHEGRCFVKAFTRVDGYIAAGLPIVTALPGWVYGNGSWFRERVIEPVMAGRHVLQYGRAQRWVSPIHIHDCVRAIVHLAEHGEIGGRYFLVNAHPIRVEQFALDFARLANRPLHLWRVPGVASRFIAGALPSGSLNADAVFSNIRLRGSGFHYLYPTLEKGLEQVLGVINE